MLADDRLGDLELMLETREVPADREVIYTNLLKLYARHRSIDRAINLSRRLREEKTLNTPEFYQILGELIESQYVEEQQRQMQQTQQQQATIAAEESTAAVSEYSASSSAASTPIPSAFYTADPVAAALHPHHIFATAAPGPPMFTTHQLPPAPAGMHYVAPDPSFQYFYPVFPGYYPLPPQPSQYVAAVPTEPAAQDAALSFPLPSETPELRYVHNLCINLRNN